ncbi:hypothetical protein Bca4012_033621 [Brassica carinata]
MIRPSFVLYRILNKTILLVGELKWRIVRVSNNKDAESEDLLQRLGYNVSELKRLGEISARSEINRFSPGGPDPQHHSYPLSSKP